jgi:ABC-type phosphate transport system substrate-binding protein
MKKIIPFMLTFFGLVQLIAAQDVIVITNGGSTTLAKTDIEQLFLGKKTSWGTSKVVIATLKTGTAHETFMKEYMGKQPDQYLMYWKQLVFTGRGTMPQAFTTDQELIAFVAKTPGAIGYISPAGKSGITDQLKTVTVQK